MLPLLLFPLGFILLIKGANWLVEGASSIAKKFNISELVIGLTIVAFGTSLPELLVTVLASFQGATDLAIGSVIGSNISNIFLILGICAVIYPLSVTKGTVWKEIPLNLLAILAVFFLVNDALIDGTTTSAITRIDGLILILFFIIFVYYSLGIAKNPTVMTEVGQEKIAEEKRLPKLKTSTSILYLIAGFIGISAGGELVIRGALSTTAFFGVSESFVGLTLVALGTSAPELATSAVAAYKKSADIAIGNIVGSNLFNLLWVLGLAAIINPLPLNGALNIDIAVCILATVLLFLFTAVQNHSPGSPKKMDGHHLSRTEGILFLGCYIGYLIYLVWRG